MSGFWIIRRAVLLVALASVGAGVPLVWSASAYGFAEMYGGVVGVQDGGVAAGYPPPVNCSGADCKAQPAHAGQRALLFPVHRTIPCGPQGSVACDFTLSISPHIAHVGDIITVSVFSTNGQGGGFRPYPAPSFTAEIGPKPPDRSYGYSCQGIDPTVCQFKATAPSNVDVAYEESQPGIDDLSVRPGSGPASYVALQAGGPNELRESDYYAILPGPPDHRVVVNTTGDQADDPTNLSNGVCDVDPNTDGSQCTLRAALQVTNASGGGKISFNIPGSGVPVITITSSLLPDVPANTTIDGSTQPGGKVELLLSSHAPIEGDFNAPGTPGLRFSGRASTVRGMVIDGFYPNLEIPASGGGETIQGNFIGPDPSGTHAGPDQGQIGLLIQGSSGNLIGGLGAGQGNLISGNGIVDVLLRGGSGNNVFQGNTIGPALGGKLVLDPQSNPRYRTSAVVSGFEDGFIPQRGQLYFGIVATPGSANIVGGSAAGSGNTIVGFVDLHDNGDEFRANTVSGGGGADGRPNLIVLGDRNVVQENHLSDLAGVSVNGAHNTFGGAASTPGSQLGNDVHTSYGASFEGEGNVVQGNLLVGGSFGIQLYKATRTEVGGALPELGNSIEGPGPNGGDGVVVWASSDNRVENNRINFVRDGVVVDAFGSVATGNTITANRIELAQLGINLGPAGAPFRFNQAGSLFGGDPNNFQRYPDLLSANETGTLHLSGRLVDGLTGRGERFVIDVYADVSCGNSWIQPGLGARLLTQHTVISDGLGTAAFEVSIAAGALKGDRAFTATATAPDGSTSEFSPCLRIGLSAPGFEKVGVTIPTHTIAVAAESPSGQAQPAAAKKPKPKPKPPAKIALFCPPRTTGLCGGSGTLTTTGRKPKTVARFSFRLAPGQVGNIVLRLTATGRQLLAHNHRLPVRATITAHDGATHPHHKTTTGPITLIRVTPR